MEALGAAASIAGLITAAGEIAKIVKPYASAVGTGVPSIALQVSSEIQNTWTVLTAVDSLTKDLSSAKNTSVIQIDQIVAVLTDGVLVFSKLQHLAGTLLDYDPFARKLPFRSRLQWARRESAFTALLARLFGFKNSLSLILTILQSDSSIKALKHQIQLESNLETLLENNQDLRQRLMNLESARDAQKILSKSRIKAPRTDGHTPSTRTPTIGDHKLSLKHNYDQIQESYVPDMSQTVLSPPEFEVDLKTSWVYRRVKRNSMDVSFRTSVARSNMWSMFSGLSLSEVSTIAVIALPVSYGDLTNPQCYSFDNPQQINSQKTPFDQPLSISAFQDYEDIRVQLMQIAGFPYLFDDMKHLFGDIRLVDRVTTVAMDELLLVFACGFPLLVLFAESERQCVFHPRVCQGTMAMTKTALLAFMESCVRSGDLDAGDVLTLSDLERFENVQFSRVMTVLRLILNRTKHREIIQPINPFATNRNNDGDSFFDITHVIGRFLFDERVYTMKLEWLVETLIQFLGLLPSDPFHQVLSKLMSTQLDFFKALETTASTNITEHHWAIPFTFWGPDTHLHAKFFRFKTKGREVIRSLLRISQFPLHTQRQSSLAMCFSMLSLPLRQLSVYLDFLQDLKTCDGMTENQLEEIGIARSTIQAVVINAQSETILSI